MFNSIFGNKTFLYKSKFSTKLLKPNDLKIKSFDGIMYLYKINKNF